MSDEAPPPTPLNDGLQPPHTPLVVESESFSPPPPPETPEPKEPSIKVVEREEPSPVVPLPDLTEESRSLSAVMDSDPPLIEAEEFQKLVVKFEEEVVVVEAEKGKGEVKKQIPHSLVSFKEESNKVSDLLDFQHKALEELKQLVQEALSTHQFSSPLSPPPQPADKQEESEVSTLIPEEKSETLEEEEVIIPPQEVVIWGIPLLEDDRSDVILLKFLRARDFKVRDAFTMIKNTIKWRKEFDIDGLVDEDLGDDLEKVVFMHGHDREKHPVCYNVYGEFQNKDLYQKTFSDAEKRTKFLRWRIQFLEKSIRKLDFSSGGINTIFQVNDLKNSPGPGKRELRLATSQALQLLQDNYPEFVAKQVFVNVPWWYIAFYTMISPFMTQRTKSKFVFAGPSKSAEMLFKYISPEQVPIQYGGLSVDYCDCNPEFTIADPVTDITVKPATKQTVEIIIYEKCVIVWELRVVGWEVSYGVEFVPDAKDAYTVIIQKPKKMAPNDEPVMTSSFNVAELGKLLLTIDNPTSKKKKLLYRFKVNPYHE